MAKKKPSSVAVSDQQQAEGVLAEIASIDRKLVQVQVTMNEELDAAKQKAAEAKAPLESRRKELEAALKKWAMMNKGVLFVKRRSLDLAFGSLGFQAGTRIQQMDGVSPDESLEKVRQYGFKDGIRVTEELNKEAMESWTDDRLALVGLVRRNFDTYWCKVNQEKLASV